MKPILKYNAKINNIKNCLMEFFQLETGFPHRCIINASFCCFAVDIKYKTSNTK